RARSLDRDYADAVERQLRQHNPVHRTQEGHLQNRQDPLSKVVAQRVDCRASGALSPAHSVRNGQFVRDGGSPTAIVVELPESGDVRYWPIADIPSCTAHVRFWG